MSEPSEEDLREMRDMMLGVIDFPPTDDELRTAWTNPRLVSLAREWGWGDTELRDELAAELEQIRRTATAPAGQSLPEMPELAFRVGRLQKILDPDSKFPIAVHLDEAALRDGAPGSESRRPRATSTYSGAEQHEQAEAGAPAGRLEGEGDAMDETEPGAGATSDVAVPAGPAPSTPVTLLLIVLLAVAGGAAIVLLTGLHQLWAGLACAVAAVAALWAADRRLRRRADIRRLAAAADGDAGLDLPRSPGPEGRS